MREKEEEKGEKSSVREGKSAKALSRGESRANVMQECQLQMERGIYIPAIMAPAWLVNGLDCTTRGVVVGEGRGERGREDGVWFYSTVQQIRSADTSNGLDHWGYLRKGGRWIWGKRGWEDQGVSSNRTVGMITATVQPCECVPVCSVSKRTLNKAGSSL